MPKEKHIVVPNQVFVGLPWNLVRPRYERCIDHLKKKYPLHFTIVGRKERQDAEDLLETIKDRILASSYGIFDATSGNANVSLEYGYAEGINISRQIFLSKHKASNRGGSAAMIANLSGKRRVEYTTEASLFARLEIFCKEHDYTKRFERFLFKRFKSSKRGQKKRLRTLALKIIHFLDGKEEVRRTELVQSLQVQEYGKTEIEDMLKKLHSNELLAASRGRFSTVQIA